jgi:DNA-binding NtrC family response regulator
MSVTIHDRMPGPILVGKSVVCALRLSAADVSRRHLSMEVRGEEVRVCDLDSTNRTFVNDLPVEAAFLRGGETIRIGLTTLRVERASSSREPPAVSTETQFRRLIGASREVRRLHALFLRIATSTVPAIIEGETGTGKEALAEALHEAGPRAEGPFVVFDCTATPANLIESELFGHERGAFTGAESRQKGVFEQADGGTLLIDEIGDLDIALQPKLLRAIERSEVRRLGGHGPIRVNVRILAATRRNLDEEVIAGRFRDDLFHRLAVARVELPPLRARKGDVGLLAAHFWAAMGGDPRALSAELIERWEAYDWPGNVRELRNAVARQIALGDDATLPHSPAPSSQHPHGEIERILALDLPLPRSRGVLVKIFEQRYLERVLARHDGNVTRAAAASGIARRHFYRLLARTGED